MGNHNSENYKELVDRMLNNYQEIGANMSIKVHFLYSLLDRFPENCADVSDEQGERFRQDIKTMKGRYQGLWDESIMVDYYWILKRDMNVEYSRQSRKKKIIIGAYLFLRSFSFVFECF